MNTLRQLLIPIAAFLCAASTQAQIPAFPLTQTGLVISRPTQPPQPFTVAGPRGVLVGTQDGQFESWILPIKLLSHLTIEANLEGYSVPIPVNPQSANIEVRPDHTTITYSHPGFTIRQIMFSPADNEAGMTTADTTPTTGPVVLFQIDANHPLDLVFRFTPEMRWMWPKRNDGIPSPEWVPTKPQNTGEGFYMLHMDYPDIAGAITIPTATPGILAPYQERPQVHPLELRVHYDPKRDGTGVDAKYFPLLMAVGTTPQTTTAIALRQDLDRLNAAIPNAYKAQADHYTKLITETTTIETPDKSLNEAFNWGVVSIEQLKAHEFVSNQDALVAGYYASGDSARPGFGWFFGRDALYTLYAVNGFGDFALTRSELEFLIARQRPEGKIMHEFSQTASDPTVAWKSFPYMYAAADATPLFLMAVRDYYRASNDLAFLQKNREAIEKAWAFETDPAHDTDHDGIYDNSQGTGWVESWPATSGSHGMPHQEVYLALLDQQASQAYAALETVLGDKDKAANATTRAAKIHSTIESEYYDPEKGCYAFSHNPDGTQDKASTVYPSIAYWDTDSSLAHPAACLSQWASPTIATDWGLRDVATTEPFYDGLSYHQGSVWPLFTGWGSLAEYRANQPLAGEQMLMQNVDLTWAQDPGAVTELLSGDWFVPFGRSTSHQLWSSAMVITPTLRGLFGISLDAATNTITVNPHLPANWTNARVSNLHLGNRTLILNFYRERDRLRATIADEDAKTENLHLRSDYEGTKTLSTVEISIPLPAIELSIPAPALPSPGSRPSQIKVLSTEYGTRSLTVRFAGQPNTNAELAIRRNQAVYEKIKSVTPGDHPNEQARIISLNPDLPDPTKRANEPTALDLHFPQGQGWQTLEVTLTW
ncbi:amylo-alpha-1,6-glucosidase [Acidicapsa acidisoli]|uniref:amylo-alpha-1,6-glucosidase n=1 Tax=Acidicapsa acidisoli TaxID=1615681 RepID=UPI0021E0FAFB|nr:amylo-alpha-1,6-glucosidase [Acidicapsa acidisoli]